ncbi:hypothetical protein H7J88_17825 [Mycolicibacterium flavescens]|uniref:Uncharacterized protein n=1 Tax=Mycolicibacterium flavescens TaxID=1776 RepID=A0A1E3RAS3_MYCFV|nr:hypothetical protein [Mycolicibacterium flavescens]MCV7281495.1 hypothetical protein [Mycolicibacterium flavescens]ODQ87040.1 hypothetical protein BHQ18_25575 [Mycolicibacterium flavescens]
MSGPHPDLGPELRQLAQSILDKLDPAVRMAAARAAAGEAGSCQQVWCPVCALAALVAGEQHPLLTVIAEHSVALLAVIRALLEQAQHAAPGPDEPPDGPPPAPGAGPDGPAPPPPGRYQHIPVTVEE